MQINVPLNAGDYSAQLATDTDAIARRGKKQATIYGWCILASILLDSCFSLLIYSYIGVEMDPAVLWFRMLLPAIFALALMKIGSKSMVLSIVLSGIFSLSYDLWREMTPFIVESQNILITLAYLITLVIIIGQIVGSIFLLVSKPFTRYCAVSRKIKNVSLPKDAFTVDDSESTRVAADFSANTEGKNASDDQAAEKATQTVRDKVGGQDSKDDIPGRMFTIVLMVFVFTVMTLLLWFAIYVIAVIAAGNIDALPSSFRFVSLGIACIPAGFVTNVIRKAIKKKMSI